jgi:hypothetical protein
MKANTQSKLFNEIGPNGGRVRINRNGDTVERVPGERWDMVLRRGVKQILKAEKEFADKTLWVRWAEMECPVEDDENLDVVWTPEERAKARAIAAPIEAKYGCIVDLKDEYIHFKLGMIVGKLSALRWILGYDWDLDDAENPLSANAHPHRTYAEIYDVEGDLEEQVWWNRRQIDLERIAAGEEPPLDPKFKAEIAAEIAKIEKKYGRDNLGWNNFEWGRLNGKFSAIRWVLGHEWDFLDI